jgi:phage-related minor tail protein
MAILRDDALWAAAQVVAGVGPTIAGQDGGFSGVVRNGAGDYTLTLDADRGIVRADGNVQVTSNGATFASANVVHTSATAKQILFFDAAGAAVDPVGFDIAILRVH